LGILEWESLGFQIYEIYWVRISYGAQVIHILVVFGRDQNILSQLLGIKWGIRVKLKQVQKRKENRKPRVIGTKIGNGVILGKEKPNIPLERWLKSPLMKVGGEI